MCFTWVCNMFFCSLLQNYSGLCMELSVRERQKALTVTLAMLCIACACLFYLGYRLCMYY